MSSGCDAAMDAMASCCDTIGLTGDSRTHVCIHTMHTCMQTFVPSAPK